MIGLCHSKQTRQTRDDHYPDQCCTYFTNHTRCIESWSVFVIAMSQPRCAFRYNVMMSQARFFQGLPAANLYEDKTAAEVLRDRRSLLLGTGLETGLETGTGSGNRNSSGVNGEEARNPPWIRCCLVSYQVQDAKGERRRRIEIFDTVLVPR